MPFNPINYGNIAAQGENILAARQRRDPNSMQNQLLAAQLQNERAKLTGGVQPTYGKQIQYAKDGDVLRGFAVGDDGSVKELELPPGMTWADTYTAKDMGGFLQLVGRLTGFQGQPPTETVEPDLGDIPQSRLPPQAQPQPLAQNPYGTQKKTVPPQNLPENVAAAESAKVSAALNAEAGLDPQGNPIPNAQTTASIASDVAEAGYKQDFKWKALIQAKIKEAEKLAAARGEALTDVRRMQAGMPGLRATIKNLKELSDVATYTLIGQGWDEAVKQFGFGSTEGANARAQFISIVNNQVLPLLKETFGAAFTVQEGESLKATMGDPNHTPEEKKAVLDAFINQKEANIKKGQGNVELLTFDMKSKLWSGADKSGETYEQKRQRILGQ